MFLSMRFPQYVSETRLSYLRNFDYVRFGRRIGFSAEITKVNWGVMNWSFSGLVETCDSTV